MSTKAAETGTLLVFITMFLREHYMRVHKGAVLLSCGEALVEYLLVTRRAGEILDLCEAQKVMDSILRFLSLYEEAEVSYIPKYHMAVHLGRQAFTLGNPIQLGTWHDESLNLQLARISAAAHPGVFERRVLATFNHCDVPMPGSSRESKKPRV